jgi:hypothetical protein
MYIRERTYQRTDRRMCAKSTCGGIRKMPVAVFTTEKYTMLIHYIWL